MLLMCGLIHSCGRGVKVNEQHHLNPPSPCSAFSVREDSTTTSAARELTIPWPRSQLWTWGVRSKGLHTILGNGCGFRALPSPIHLHPILAAVFPDWRRIKQLDSFSATQDTLVYVPIPWVLMLHALFPLTPMGFIWGPIGTWGLILHII